MNTKMYEARLRSIRKGKEGIPSVIRLARYLLKKNPINLWVLHSIVSEEELVRRCHPDIAKHIEMECGRILTPLVTGPGVHKRLKGISEKAGSEGIDIPLCVLKCRYKVGKTEIPHTIHIDFRVRSLLNCLPPGPQVH